VKGLQTPDDQNLAWLSLSMTLRVSEAGFKLRMTSPKVAIN
jgi:hypothetical protein